jgi:GntR family transcriptional regulator/MocR family aminotransferase
MTLSSYANFSLDRAAAGTLKSKLRDEILRRIRLGTLRPGDRLPPSRRLADDLAINRGTVSAVYDELVEGGVLTSHVGRGTFVSPEVSLDVLGPEGSAGDGYRWRDHFSDAEPWSRERALLAEAMARGGGGKISFAGLVPDEAFFPAETFRKALNDVLREEGSALLSYGPPNGHDGFLAFLRAYLSGQRGVAVSDEELLVVNGSQQALDLLGRAFLRPGDTVLVESPSYYGALEIFKGYGARFVTVPVDDEGMVVEEMEPVLARERPKLIYVMPTFQNPTGSCMSPERRDALVKLAVRYEIPLVEDDFDGELYYGDPPPPAVKAQPAARDVIYIGTPSKMLFPGLRIGWVAAPAPVIRRLSRMKQLSDLSGSQLLQAALARFARSGGLETHTARVRAAYGERVDRLLRALKRHMPAGVSWTRPRGGLSLLVALPAGADSSELLKAAADAGVVFTPGRLFFLNDGARYLRLSFGTVATDDVDEGVRRLARVIKQALGRGVRGPAGRDVALPPV